MQCSRSTQSPTTMVHSAQTATLTSLVPDVLPNIFSRLPTSDLLNFGYLNKEARQRCETLLIPKAIALFNDFDVGDCQHSLQRLAAFFRNGCANISDENWQALLNKTEAYTIDRQLFEVLLFAFASEEIALPAIPSLLRLHEKPFSGTSLHVLIPDHHFERRRSAISTFVFQISLMEMFDKARCNNNSVATHCAPKERRGWPKLTAIFKKCETSAQIRILSKLRPKTSDAPEIHLAFEELVVAHIGNLENERDFVFVPSFYRDGELDAYYTVLADYHTFTSSVGEPACFMLLFSKPNPYFPDHLPWKESSRGTCNFVFRLLAAEIRENKTRPGFESHVIEALALRRFISRKELDYFARQLNSQMDQGITLEDAVSKWLDDNKAGECVIS